MKVYYIRHGQSMNNVINDLADVDYDKQRSKDPSLSDLGKLQTELLVGYLNQKKIQFSEIRCSPHLRAIQTAQIIANAYKVPIKVQQNIHEKGGLYFKNEGFPGATRQELLEKFPNLEIDEKIQDKGWYFKDYKETDEESRARAEQVIQDLSTEQNKSIAIIGHGNFMDLVLGVVCQRAQNSKYYYYHQNCAITYLKNDGHGFELDYYNDYSFLQMHYLQTGQDVMLERIANPKGKN